MYTDYGSNPNSLTNNINLNNSAFAAQLHPLLNQSIDIPSQENKLNSEQITPNGNLANAQIPGHTHSTNTPDDPGSGGVNNASLLNTSQIERGGGGGDAVQVSQALQKVVTM